jgi:hypothetical protein
MSIFRFVVGLVGLVFGMVAGLSFMTGIFSWLCYGLAEGVGHLWTPLVLPIYGLELVLLGTILVIIYATKADAYNIFDFPGQLVLVEGALAFLLVFIFVWGQFLRHWSLQFGGFSPNGGDDLAWTLYTISWMLDNGLGNVGQIFGWSISSIHPVNDTARTLVWVYNLLLEFLAIAAVVKVVGTVASYLRGRKGVNAPPSGSQTGSA